jgi:hypothetical protein
MRGVSKLDPAKLLSALKDHRVEFVIIGAFSLAAHGVVRATKDGDIVPEPSPANLKRLARALRSIGAEPDIGELDQKEPGVEPDEEGLTLGGNWALRTKHGRLDVMQDVPGLRSWQKLRAGAVELDGALYAGYDELISMKSASARDEDLTDIAKLKAARGEGALRMPAEPPMRCHAASDSFTDRRRIQIDADHSGHSIQVGIATEQRRALTPGDSGDHAVDHPARGHSDLTAAAIDPGRGVEVRRRIKHQPAHAQQQAAQIPCLRVVPRSGEDLHHDRLGDHQRPVRGDQLGNSLVDGAAGRTVELNPGRCVSKDHAAARGAESAGISPIAPAPRMPSASSRVIGWPARWRSASSTASVLVRTP